ncbi:MAG: hypothetical protein WBG45_11950 [Paenisporosarcina sp.]
MKEIQKNPTDYTSKILYHSSKGMYDIVSKNDLKTEIPSISVTGGRFPRVVRVPPRSLSLSVGSHLDHFSRWSRRPSLQSNEGLHFCITHRKALMRFQKDN